MDLFIINIVIIKRGILFMSVKEKCSAGLRLFAAASGAAVYSNISFNKDEKIEEAKSIRDKTDNTFQRATKDQKFSIIYYGFRADNQKTFAGHSAMALCIDDSPVNHYGLHPDKLFGVLPTTSLMLGSVAKATSSYEEEIELEEFVPEKIEITVSYDTACKINELMNRKRMLVAENKIVFSVFPNSLLSFIERHVLGKEVENCASSVSNLLKEGGILQEETRIPEKLVNEMQNKVNE